MACELNLKAPNGRDSILFKDIVKATVTSDDAIDMYFYTKTDAFVEEYQGKNDLNGEPIYDDIAAGRYTHGVDYAKVELDYAAEIFKKLVNNIPKIIAKIENRIEYLQYKGDNTHVANLQKLLEILETESVNTSIPKFFESASAHVNSLYQIAETAFKKPAVTREDIVTFSGLNKTASSYDIIGTMKSQLLDSSEVASLFSDSFKMVDGTTEKINDIQNFYVAKSKEFLVEEFHKDDPTWSKKDIRAVLDSAPQDVTWTEYQVMHMGDSKDRLLFEASKRLRGTDHKARRQGIDFSKDLQGKLEAVEAEYSGKADTVFDDILVEHNNELHVIDTTVTADNTTPLHQKMLAKLATIKGRPALMDFLVFYNDTMRTLDVGLPTSSKMGTRMPSVMRSELELLQGGNMADKYNVLKDNMRNKIIATNLDMEKGQLKDSTGKPVKRIPTFYTQKYNSVEYKKAYKKIYDIYTEQGKSHEEADILAEEAAEAKAKSELLKVISRDVASNLQAFHVMATSFTAKYEQVHVFDAIAEVVGSEKRTYGNSDVTGPESTAYKQLMKVYDMQLYGMRQEDLGAINILGTNVDVNKGLRGVTRATSILQIPFNLTAAGANTTYGEYSNLMEAAGGEYYSFKNLKTASTFYRKDTSNMLGDIGARTPSSIVNLIEEHYDLLQNYGGEQISTAERTRMRRLLKTSTAYFLTSGAEHLLQVRSGLAMLDATKTYDKSGTEIGTLLNVHSLKEGKLVIDDVYIKEKDGSLVQYNTKQQNRIGDKIGGVNRKSHGNYSPKTAGAAKQHALGDMLLQFRGWMAESAKKRYGKASPNHLLEQDVEGFYRSGGRALFSFARDIKKFNLAVAKENWAHLTPHEKANIRRFLVEASMITVTALASVMFGKIGKEIEDDYDGDNWEDRLALGAFRFSQYELLRFRAELSAYASIPEALKLLRSPAATVSLGESLYELTAQMAYPLEEYEAGWRKGENRLKVKLGKTLPFYKHLVSFTPEGLHERSKWLN
jgi:hypothetical protein